MSYILRVHRDEDFDEFFNYVYYYLYFVLQVDSDIIKEINILDIQQKPSIFFKLNMYN